MGFAEMKRHAWGLSVVLLGACTPASEGPVDRTGGVEQEILDGAQRAVGLWPTPVSLHVLADATVEGPSGEFRTVIHSSSDGRVRMQQSHSGFQAGVGRTGGWLVNSDSSRTDMPGEVAAFVRSHEVHMLALLPTSRLEDPEFLGTQQLDSQPVMAVAFSSDSVVAYFSQADTLPVGLRFAWIEPEVVVHWRKWTELSGVALFREATFVQGPEEWHYTYDRLDLSPLQDSVFEASAVR